MGARKKELTLEDIKDLQYISIKEILKRTTFGKTVVKEEIACGNLKSEKKRGRRVIKVSDFVEWWNGLSDKSA